MWRAVRGGRQVVKDNLPPSKFLPEQPQGQILGLHCLRGSANAVVAVKGVNTQVLAMNALICPPRPAGN